MKKIALPFLVVFGILSVASLARADVSIPTTTEVYFEKNGAPFNKKVDFTVKGYGYSYPAGSKAEKEPGSYTPEVVYSFSASYEKYGDTIEEDYYKNYRHIDYYELEGETKDGKKFTVEDIQKMPTECEEDGWKERNCRLEVDLDKANWQQGGGDQQKQQKSFWSKITCFFMRLIGKSC
ncbi:MAG: hypothetical protein R6V40_04320 [Candidatus Moraniibacteriota bacterium]